MEIFTITFRRRSRGERPERPLVLRLPGLGTCLLHWAPLTATATATGAKGRPADHGRSWTSRPLQAQAWRAWRPGGPGKRLGPSQEDDRLRRREPSRKGSQRCSRLTGRLARAVLSRCFSVLLFSVGAPYHQSPGGEPKHSDPDHEGWSAAPSSSAFSHSLLLQTRCRFPSHPTQNSDFQEVLNIGNWKKPVPPFKASFPWELRKGFVGVPAPLS